MAQQPEMTKGTPDEVQERIAAQIPENVKPAFTKILAAGDKTMFSDNTHKHFIKALNQEGDLAEIAGQKMADLIIYFFQESNGDMPMEAAVPAGISLIAKAAEFLQSVTGEQIPPDMIARATEFFVIKVGEALNVPPDKLMMVAEKAAQGGYQ